MLGLIQFQMEELANEIGDRRIVLENMIFVEKDSLFFRSRGTKTRGVNCLSRILRQTNWNGLTFRNVTAGDWYKELMSRQGLVLNVGIEKGELLMEEAMMGYAMCYRMNGANSSAELRTVVQGKYYRHLEKICWKIIERFEDRNGKLVDFANSLIERKELMSGAQLNVKKMCGEWKGLIMYKCVGTRFNV